MIKDTIDNHLDGFQNIRRCVDVNGCKVAGLKSHYYHVLFQKLLTLVVHHILPKDVVIPLIQLSRFFNSICSKELEDTEIEQQFDWRDPLSA